MSENKTDERRDHLQRIGILSRRDATRESVPNSSRTDSPKRKKHPEAILQKRICAYLRDVHPDVLFLSDTGSGVKLTMPQAVRNKSIQCDSFSCPDLILFEPRGSWHGLFLELKAQTPFKKTGELYSSSHLEAQRKTLELLILRGYQAVFAWEYGQAIGIIARYLGVGSLS